MIEESATVVSVEGDIITVEAAVKSTCSGCNVQTNCGTGAIARAFSKKVQRLTLSSPMPVNVGEVVVVGIEEKSVLIASWWLYLAPLFVFIAANAGLHAFFTGSLHELWVFGLSMVPTFAIFVWVSGHIKRLDRGRFHPVLIRKR